MIIGENDDVLGAQALQKSKAHRITPYPEVRTLLPWWDRHLPPPSLSLPCRVGNRNSTKRLPATILKTKS